MKTFSATQALNLLLPHTIPGKATGGWAAPKVGRHRIQETRDPTQEERWEEIPRCRQVRGDARMCAPDAEVPREGPASRGPGTDASTR